MVSAVCVALRPSEDISAALILTEALGRFAEERVPPGVQMAAHGIQRPPPLPSSAAALPLAPSDTLLSEVSSNQAAIATPLPS